jgi:hypothetical protein
MNGLGLHAAVVATFQPVTLNDALHLPAMKTRVDPPGADFAIHSRVFR